MVQQTLIFGGVLIPVSIILWYAVAASAEAKRQRRWRSGGFLAGTPKRR